MSYYHTDDFGKIPPTLDEVRLAVPGNTSHQAMNTIDQGLWTKFKHLEFADLNSAIGKTCLTFSWLRDCDIEVANPTFLSSLHRLTLHFYSSTTNPTILPKSLLIELCTWLFCHCDIVLELNVFILDMSNGCTSSWYLHLSPMISIGLLQST